MAFQLLKNVAAKALNKVGGAASSAFNYLSKNAPEVIDQTLESNIHTRPFSQRGRQEISQFGQAANRVLKDDTAPGVYLGRLLQKIPKVETPSYDTPEGKVSLPNVNIGTGIYNLLSEIPRSAGRSIEAVSGEKNRALAKSQVYQLGNQLKNKQYLEALQNPATENILNATDVLTLGAGTLTSSLLKKGAKEVAEVGVRNVAKNSLKQVAEKEAQVATNTIFKEATEQGAPVVKKTAELFKKIPEKIPKNSFVDKAISTYERIVLPRVQRLEKMLPTDAFSALKTNVINPLHKDLGEGAVWINNYFDKAKSLKIKPGSQDDFLIRDFVNGTRSVDDITSEFGEKVAQKVTNAGTQLRQMYDEIFTLVNEKRKAAGLEQIAYKKDFLSQVGTGKGQTSIIDDLTQGGVSSGKSQSLFKKQTAKATTGAVESFIDYLDSAKQGGFIDTHAPALAEFAEKLRAAGADEGVLSYLKDYEDTLLGKKSYGGVIDAIDKFTSKMRGSAVLGNPSTLVAQTFNLPQAIAESGLGNFARSFSRESKIAAKSSPYLQTLSEKVPIALTKGKGKKVVKAMGTALQEANKSVADRIWRSFYEQGKKNGAEDLVQYADDMAVQLMGDRRIGAGSEFYSSPLGKIVGAFTLENQAGINRLIKSIGEKKAGTVIGTLAAWHVGNNVNERFGAGYRPFLDPYQAGKDMLEQLGGSDRRDPSVVKTIGRFIGEASKLSPALQSSFFTLYKGGELAGVLPDSRDVFGTEDPTWMNTGSLYNPLKNVGRDITGNNFIDEPLNIASKFIPGVNPVSKVIQATNSLNDGFVESRNGKIMYETPDNLLDKTRSVLFGQYSTPEAQAYFDNENSRPLSDDETAIVKGTDKASRGDLISNISAQNIQERKLQIPEEGTSSKLFGGKKTSTDSAVWDTVPKSKTEKENFSTLVDTALENGAELPDSAIITRFFDGKTYDKSARTGQQEILDSMLKVSEDEYLTPEQKDKIAKAGKIDPTDLDYYKNASMDSDDRLEGLLTYAAGASEGDRDEFMENLIMGKKQVGGKSMFSTTMYDRLYDEGLISKEEKKLITAVKYDPIFNKFYMDRDYKGGGGGSGGSGGAGGLTPAKVKSYVNKINALFKNTIKSDSNANKRAQELAKPVEAPKIRFSDSPGRAPARGSSSRWFTQY